MKSEGPLVSVVIPCYNHEQFVQDSIQSVIDQTYNNIELIIIDDGSRDASVEKIQEMLEACKERFVRFEFRHRANLGLSATLNEALEWCQGKYFSALASDDMMLPEKTKIQVSYMETEVNINALFGSADYIDEKSNKKTNICLEKKEYTFNKIILNECSFYAPTQMLRLSAVKEVGCYRPDILVEDWYMWLKLSEKGKIYCLSEKLALYRVHSSNATRNSQFIYDNNLKTLENYKDHKLYAKSYAKLRWTYMIWMGQENKKESFNLLCKYIRQNPKQIFSRNFLVYNKYFFRRIKDWY